MSRVEYDDVGFRVTGASVIAVAWTEILEVVAYKEDLFGFDRICLGFRTEGQGDFRSVSEDAEGYRAFLAELPRRLPGMRTDWFNEVAFPAFATQWTPLWSL